MRLDDLTILKSVDYFNWNVFNDQTVYITGATGLIGKTLVEAFLACSKAKIVIQVRNEEKARSFFQDRVEYVVCDILSKSHYAEKVDYIIHCANPTSSKFFISNPVETINTAINGTIKILEFAKNKNVQGFVFLSTMEVYGTPNRGHKVTVNEGGFFDSSVVRNCYPLSKQVCESLCSAYASEYGVHSRVLRLTQTFGPGIEYNDGRVFAEFARCALEKKDIILKTRGETERSYLYTIDAVTAILTVLSKGNDGENYVAANEDTYCSIFEMAKMIADSKDISVVIEEQDTTLFGYADTLYMDLDTSKLRELGWIPEVDLEEAYHRLVESLSES